MPIQCEVREFHPAEGVWSAGARDSKDLNSEDIDMGSVVLRPAEGQSPSLQKPGIETKMNVGCILLMIWYFKTK